MCIAIKAMRINTQNQFAANHVMTFLLPVCRRAGDRWKLLVRYIVDRIMASTRVVRRNQPALPATAAG
jgi:hypothetical protein